MWNLLGGIYFTLSLLYLDNFIYDPIPEKVIDFKDHYKYSKKIYNFFLTAFEEKMVYN